MRNSDLAYEVLIERDSGGKPQGRDPRALGRDEIGLAGHEKSPILSVIRAKCLDCSGYQQSEVRKCTAVRCALWPYRMGANPFSDRKGNPSNLNGCRRAPKNQPNSSGEK